MSTLLPETQFAYADLLLSTVIGGTEEANIPVYDALIKESCWSANTALSIPTTVCEKFEQTLKNMEFYWKVHIL